MGRGLFLAFGNIEIVPEMQVLALHVDELAKAFEIRADALSGECRGIATVQIEDQFDAVFIHMILLGIVLRGSRIMGPMWCGVHNNGIATPSSPVNPG